MAPALVSNYCEFVTILSEKSPMQKARNFKMSKVTTIPTRLDSAPNSKSIFDQIRVTRLFLAMGWGKVPKILGWF